MIARERFPYDHNDRQLVVTIAEIELESISAIVIATVALIVTSLKSGFHTIATIAKCFFSDRSDHSDRII